MDRYTYRGEGDYPLAYISCNYFNYECERIKGFAPERLAAYEDTNLTPAEIIAQRDELAAIRAECESKDRAYKALYEDHLVTKAHCHKCELRANAAETDNRALWIEIERMQAARAALEGGQDA